MDVPQNTVIILDASKPVTQHRNGFYPVTGRTHRLVAQTRSVVPRAWQNAKGELAGSQVKRQQVKRQLSDILSFQGETGTNVHPHRGCQGKKRTCIAGVKLKS